MEGLTNDPNFNLGRCISALESLLSIAEKALLTSTTDRAKVAVARDLYNELNKG